MVANVADGDAMFFGDLVSLFGKLTTTFFRRSRDVEANYLAVIRRRKAEVGGDDSFFNGAHLRGIPRLNGQHRRFRYGDRCHLAQRRRDAIVVDQNGIEHTDRRTSGANITEFSLKILNDRIHLRSRFFYDFLCTHMISEQ